jgi:hypothetical protein
VQESSDLHPYDRHVAANARALAVGLIEFAGVAPTPSIRTLSAWGTATVPGLTDGTEYTNDNIAVFRFEDGLISAYHDYFDPRRFQTVVDAVPDS